MQKSVIFVDTAGRPGPTLTLSHDTTGGPPPPPVTLQCNSSRVPMSAVTGPGGRTATPRGATTRSVTSTRSEPTELLAMHTHRPASPSSACWITRSSSVADTLESSTTARRSSPSSARNHLGKSKADETTCWVLGQRERVRYLLVCWRGVSLGEAGQYGWLIFADGDNGSFVEGPRSSCHP